MSKTKIIALTALIILACGMTAIDNAVSRMWFKWLNRRSQRKSFNWEEFQKVLNRLCLSLNKGDIL